MTLRMLSLIACVHVLGVRNTHYQARYASKRSKTTKKQERPLCSGGLQLALRRNDLGVLCAFRLSLAAEGRILQEGCESGLVVDRLVGCPFHKRKVLHGLRGQPAV